jgi:uncharacterized membrane protein YcaP (DUF421 family)
LLEVLVDLQRIAAPQQSAILKQVAAMVPVVWHTALLYLFLILTLSLLGHRQLSELGITELVILMLLGSAVEVALVAGDTSLQAGLVSAATLLLTNRLLLALVRRWDWLERIIVGRPIPLVYNGTCLPARIREAGLSEDDVLEGMRERGYDDIKQVRLAVLEIDGAISVVPAEGASAQ